MRGFDVIMATLQAAYTGKRVELPCAVPDDIVEKLEGKLK